MRHRSDASGCLCPPVNEATLDSEIFPASGTAAYAGVMAMSWIDQIFGLRRISWADGQAVLGWRHDLPAWAWVLIVLCATVASGWAYRHMVGPRGTRVFLTILRTMLVVFVAALLAGPRLVLTQERVEPDWLVMLVDRSASMRIQDMSATDPAVSDQPPISRDAALKRAMTLHGGLFESEKLNHDRQVLWLGFDSGIYEMPPPHLNPSDIPPPSGRTTAVSTALEQALERTEGHPIGGIVLISDGRSPQNTGPDLLRKLKQRAASVFCVPMGTTSPPLDLRLTRVEAPARAFVNDVVPVTVWVDHSPDFADVNPSDVRVRMIDEHTSQVLDEVTLKQLGQDQPLRLSGESSVTGPTAWRVELIYTPGDAVNGVSNNELITHNNQKQIQLDFIDRPIRVLYVEGHPRWEYRYLKNALIREKSIESSMMLVSADRDFAQEGDNPITRLPRDEAEIENYDVIIIGDVNADYFTPGQMMMIRNHIAKTGAGLLWIAGSRDCPRAYDATALVDLLPMRQPASTRRLKPDEGPLSVKPTPLANALNVMRLTEAQDEAGSLPTAWPNGLPALTWVQDLRALKPSAETLATGHRAGSSAVPIVVRMRYGAGQSLYVATDETWRWRYGRGDLYFERFWVQLIRLLGRHRVQEGSSRAWLSVSHRQVKLGQAVVVEMHINDASLLPQHPAQVKLLASKNTAPPASPDDTIVNTPEEVSQQRRQDQILLHRVGRADSWPSNGVMGGASKTDAPDNSQPMNTAGTRVYRTVWKPTDAGRYTLRVAEGGLSDLDFTAFVEVVHPNDEWHQPLPDHDRLTLLANETGGQVIPLDQLDQLGGVIPNRARRTPNDIHEPLWDSPLSLVVVLVLVTVEWVTRKIIRLA